MAVTPKSLYDAQLAVTTVVSAYTAGTAGGATIKKITAHNPTASSVDLTVYIGRLGVAAGTTNQKFKKTVAQNETVEWTDVTHLNQTDKLYVQASTANALNVEAWGIEVS